MIYEVPAPPVADGEQGQESLRTSCIPKAWNISDDLGQIEYIFSDKTGPLTQNVMSFLRCSILGPLTGASSSTGSGGIEGGIYGEGVSEAQRGKNVREAGEQNGRTSVEVDPEEQREKIERAKSEMVRVMRSGWRNGWLDESALTLVSLKLARELAVSQKEEEAGMEAGRQKERIVSFFRALALCHTILPSHSTSTDSMGNEQKRVMYKAKSPDEAALVSCARDVGFGFLPKSPTEVTISVLGDVESWTQTPLKVLEFNSTRKRMSVILRRSDGEIILFCKGADSVIYKRLSAYHDPLTKQVTTQNLEQLANEGLSLEDALCGYAD